MIRYYLNEEPLLNNVPTYLGWNPDQLEFMLANAADLVFKGVGEAGGYGMPIGPAATRQEIDAYLEKVRLEPREFIAQPVVGLSRHPTLYPDSGTFEGSHIDLRPYVLFGQDVTIVPGGLTRVALTRGSLVVNSSQGGGSKDTWVLEDADAADAEEALRPPGSPRVRVSPRGAAGRVSRRCRAWCRLPGTARRGPTSSNWRRISWRTISWNRHRTEPAPGG